jgi:hypothetical protein
VDLNELFFRHQIALIRADRADVKADRQRFGTVAEGLAAQIGCVQRALGIRPSALERAAAA